MWANGEAQIKQQSTYLDVYEAESQNDCSPEAIAQKQQQQS